jgi:hypothetical protein
MMTVLTAVTVVERICSDFSRAYFLNVSGISFVSFKIKE